MTTPTLRDEHIALIRHLAPRIHDLVDQGADPGDALLQVLREHLAVCERAQSDDELRATIGRAVWAAARTAQTIEKAMR